MEKTLLTFPQRKLKKNYRSITGHFPSIKNKKSIAFESKLEKELFLTLEFDDTVISYQEQPQIEIYFKGKNKIYSADCYIHRSIESNLLDSIVEVKYTNELKKDEQYFKEKFEAIQNSTTEMNLDFEIYTELNNTQTYIENLDFLYRYLENPLKMKYEEQIMNIVRNFNKISALDITKKISSNPIDYQIISNEIWNLVAHKKLKSDFYDTVLTMNSLVEIQ
jgi:hypothetical protein